GGQVILSMPGSACMTCLGFLNEANLAREAALYGDAGPRPQVVWPNGVLASTAVGIAVDLLTNWTRSLRGAVYLMYDGNAGTITPHPLLVYHDGSPSPHFLPDEVGRQCSERSDPAARLTDQAGRGTMTIAPKVAEEGRDRLG